MSFIILTTIQLIESTIINSKGTQTSHAHSGARTNNPNDANSQTFQLWKVLKQASQFFPNIPNSMGRNPAYFMP